MPTIIGHAVSGYAIGSLGPRNGHSTRVAVFCAVCAVAPDLDAVGFKIGIPYGHWLGHRGFSHSIFFAVILASLFTALIAGKEKSNRALLAVWPVLFSSVMLHTVLDAVTNGGLGVGFFSPFSDARYFLPWRPIEVSPISPARFFSPRGLSVLKSEFFWVMLPSLSVIVLSKIMRNRRRKETPQ